MKKMKISKEILHDSLKTRVKGVPEETLETAGCTGSCQFFTVEGFPDCKKCEQFQDK